MKPWRARPLQPTALWAREHWIQADIFVAKQNNCFATVECRYVRRLLLSHLAVRPDGGFATRWAVQYGES
jgi:hypothetical protein